MRVFLVLFPRSPFLPPLSVSWLIAGIELFRPPRATVVVVVVLYQNKNARIQNPDDFILDLGDFILDLRFFENPIITTLKYFGPKVNLSESYP